MHLEKAERADNDGKFQESSFKHFKLRAWKTIEAQHFEIVW